MFSAGALGVPAALHDQLRVDALMDAATQIHAHGTKAKEVLEGVAAVLPGIFLLLFPGRPVPLTLPELVQSFLAEEDFFGEYYMSKTQARAKAAVTFALASGIDGDYRRHLRTSQSDPTARRYP